MTVSKYKFEFEDVIFNDFFKKEENYEELIKFVNCLLKREVVAITILDSSYIQETNDKFSIHLLMDADGIAVWLIFTFGENEDYYKQEYYCQTNEGKKLYDASPAVRYNMKKICECFDESNQDMVKEYGFILNIFKELLEDNSIK